MAKDSEIKADQSALVLSRLRPTYVGIINPTDRPSTGELPEPTVDAGEAMLIGAINIPPGGVGGYIGPANHYVAVDAAGNDAMFMDALAGPLPVGKLSTIEVRAIGLDGSLLNGDLDVVVYQSGLQMRSIHLPAGTPTVSDKGVNFWAEGGLFVIGIEQPTNTVPFNLSCALVFEAATLRAA